MNPEENSALPSLYWPERLTWVAFIYKRAIVSILTIALSAAMAFGREERVDSQGSLELDVPVPPAPVRVGNVPRLVYELRVRNNASHDVHLSQLEVVRADATAERIATVKGSELCANIGHPERNPLSQEPCDIAAGRWAMAYLWLPITPEVRVPQRFLHKLTFEFQGSSGPSVATIMGAQFQVDGLDPVVLGPPVKGGPWVAVYDPFLPLGHRRAPYIKDRVVMRIPARFAIDWIKLDQTGKASVGASLALSSFYGFGEEVLAVADARVAAVRDGYSDESTDSPTERRKPRPEDVAGNYVSLDLGRGRFAFYEHLKKGTIQVKTNQVVKAGQVIARLGRSGINSSGPHLHFHVSDLDSPLDAEGRPYVFRSFHLLGAYKSAEDAESGAPWSSVRDIGNSVRLEEMPEPNWVVAFEDK
jgi:Peptidase family M23